MQSKYWSIDHLPGLMQSEQELLKKNNIFNTKELLNRTTNTQSRRDLASQLRLNQKHVDKWTALADLSRIPSVGHQYCGLLLHAGVASVVQLAQTPFNRLHRQVLRLQVATLRRKDLSPPVEKVKQWVEEAKLLQYSSIR